MTETKRKELEEYKILYEIAQNALCLLRCHKWGPPGIKGIQEELEAVSLDNLEEYSKINDLFEFFDIKEKDGDKNYD